MEGPKIQDERVKDAIVMNFDILPRFASRLSDRIISRSQSGGVHLTFDDGPDPVKTPELLEILDSFQVKATFFITASNAEKQKPLISKIFDCGHTLASHGYEHRSFTLRSFRETFRDMSRSIVILEESSGCRPGLYRPPYGRIGPGVLKAAQKLNLTIILWSLSATDWRIQPQGAISRRILEKSTSGDIILLHDRGNGVEGLLKEMPEIIEGLRQKGLEPLPLMEKFPC